MAMNELPDSPSVSEAVARLIAVANAPTGAAALELMEEFVDEAEESGEKFDTAFLATQLLRDRGQLDADEAGIVFHFLAATRASSYEDDASAAVAFHMSRWESAIAIRIETDRGAYKKWITAGRQSLLQFPLYEEDQSVAD